MRRRPAAHSRSTKERLHGTTLGTLKLEWNRSKLTTMAADSNRSAENSQSTLFGRDAASNFHAEARLGAGRSGGETAVPGGSKSVGWAIAYTDGGSRGNPGPAGYGVLIQSPNGDVLAELSEFIGMRTNNVAEYSGLLGALEYALANGIARLRVISDSELMVKQIRGHYRVQSPELRPLYEEAKRRIAQLAAFQIEHVLRGKNIRADELANHAMDRGIQRKSTPQDPLAKRTSATAAPGDPAQRQPASPGPAAGAASTGSLAPAVRPLRGIVKDGRISLLEGSIPDGTIVVVMPEKALVAWASKP